MAKPTSAVVTFLFTDVEGSTRLVERNAASADRALTRHLALIRGAVERNAGVIFETLGDGTYSAFESSCVVALTTAATVLAR